MTMKNSYDQNTSNIKKYGSTNNSGTTIQMNNKISEKISFAFSTDAVDATFSRKDDIENGKRDQNDERKNERKHDKNSEPEPDSDADFFKFFENVPDNVPWIDSNVATHASASAKLLKSVFGEPSREMDSTGNGKSTFHSVGKI